MLEKLLNTEDIQIVKLDLEKSPKSDHLLKWMTYFLSPYLKPLSYFIGYRIFRYAYFAMLPVMVSYFVDGFQLNKIYSEYDHYAWLGTIYIFIYVFMLSNSWIFKRELIYTENASRSISILGLSILNRLPLEWHFDNASGKKIDIVMDARKSFFDLLMIFRWQFMPILGTLVGVCSSIFFIKAPVYLSLYYFLFAFSYLYTSWFLNKPVAKLFDNYKETFSKLLSRLYEFSSSILTIRSLGLENYVENKSYENEILAKDAKDKIYNIVFRRWFIVNSVAGIFLVIFSFSAFQECYNGSISTGAAASIIMLFYTLWTTLEGISVEQDRIYELNSSVRRFIKICLLAKKNSIHSYKKNESISWTNIEFKSVNFNYPDNKNFQLNNLNFKIKKDDILAIVGPSGSGKSSIIKLLLSLYQPSSGSINIGDTELSSLDPSDWIKRIAYVPQDIELFDGTIKDNILLSLNNVSTIDYENILQLTCLDVFIKELKDKDLTIIGERGIKLSGGQKQRIGIARALLRKPEILLLDEATSALDSITENKIQDLLFKNLKGITLIVIAHRLSTIRYADNIVVINEGTICEIGKFDELLKNDGLFAEMWGIQGMSRI